MRAGAAIVPALPAELAGALGEVGGAAAYAFGRTARRGIASNLAAVLGRLDPDLGALRSVMRALRAGGVAGFAIDRDVQGTGQPTPLFGRTARLSHAPAL